MAEGESAVFIFNVLIPKNNYHLNFTVYTAVHTKTVNSMARRYRFLAAKSAVSAQTRHANVCTHNATQENNDELIGDGNEHSETLFNPGNWAETWGYRT